MSPVTSSTVARRINAVLVFLGLFGAVLPALAMHGMTAIMLIFAPPRLWGAYFVGWWGLYSLLRIFVSFFSSRVRVGPITILGLAAASATVIALHWPFFIGCEDCGPWGKPEQFVYRPEELCVLVAVHWLLLCNTGFRMSFRRSYRDV